MPIDDRNRLMQDFKSYVHIGLGHFNVAMEIVTALEKNETMESAIELLMSKGLISLSNFEVSELVACIHPRGLEFFKLVKGSELNEREEKRLLLKKLPMYAMMGYYNEDDMKQLLIDVLQLTGTHIRYKDLGLILSEETINNINVLRDGKPSFIIEKNQEGKYQMTTFFKRLSDQTFPIDVDNIDFKNLVKLADTSMSAYINFPNYHRNDYMPIQEIRNLLSSGLIATYFLDKDIKENKKEQHENKPVYLLIKIPFKDFSNLKIKKLKDTAVEINSSVCISFDEIAKALAGAYRRGDNIKIMVDGEMYYSCESETISDVYAKRLNIMRKRNAEFNK